MRLDSRAFGYAAATVAAALFVLCALGIALAPAATTAMASTLIHIDLSGMTRTITWPTFFSGLVCWTVGVGLTFAAVGGLYNRFAAEPDLVSHPGVAQRIA